MLNWNDYFDNDREAGGEAYEEPKAAKPLVWGMVLMPVVAHQNMANTYLVDPTYDGDHFELSTAAIENATSKRALLSYYSDFHGHTTKRVYIVTIPDMVGLYVETKYLGA